MGLMAFLILTIMNNSTKEKISSKELLSQVELSIESSRTFVRFDDKIIVDDLSSGCFLTKRCVE
ncbi:MAG: hypothetical protein CMP48_11625 [Rickettsiales bacterium]|nr:hypothetical protein [Rickettsiales bacterium]